MANKKRGKPILENTISEPSSQSPAAESEAAATSETKLEKGGGGNPREKNFSLARLTPAQRTSLLTKFAESLRAELDAKPQTQDESSNSDAGKIEPSLTDALRKNVMRQVTEHANAKSKGKSIFSGDITTYHFEGFLRQLHRDGLLPVGTYKAAAAQEKLRATAWGKNMAGIVVVSGNDPDLFFRAAAEDFIEALFEIVERKKTTPGVVLDEHGRITVNVGLVSGRTVGGTIRKVQEISWKRDLDLPTETSLQNTRINVLALNVCLTADPHLANNASVLAHALAAKINDETRDQMKAAHAYGLSAPLLVEKGRLREVDLAPQTIDVVRFTEPHRLGSGESPKATPHSTMLDIVLSGLGELPIEGVSGGSIFYSLAKGFGFKMDELVEAEHIVGDIAFTAINATGEPVALRKHSRSATLAEDDIKDPTAFLNEIQSPSNNVSKFLHESLTKGNNTGLKDLSLKDIIAALNKLIQGAALFTQERFEGVRLTERTEWLLSSASSNHALLNRLLLQDTYPFLITKLDTEYLFYSAVQLGVLATMAQEPKQKSVILLARWEKGKQKVPAIYASLAGRERYASRLIIDEPTSRDLLLLSHPSGGLPQEV